MNLSSKNIPSGAWSALRSWLVALVLGVTILSQPGCQRSNAYINEGFEQMSSGNFDDALALFEKASRLDGNNHRLLYGLGMLLSLKNISLHSALMTLEQAYEQQQSDQLYKNLIILYLDMGLFSEARSLVTASTTIPEYFSPRMELYRDGVLCYIEPKAKQINILQAHPYSELLTYLLGRCLIRAERYDEAYEIYSEMKQSETGCELLIAWPYQNFTYSSYHVEVDGCRRNFPGSIVINRERPPDLSKLPRQERRKIFSENRFEPGN